LIPLPRYLHHIADITRLCNSLYIVDAHRDIAIESFTCILIFKVSTTIIPKKFYADLVKNFFSFGLTWSAYNWLVQNGTFNTFMVISSIQVVICLLSVPMCKSMQQIPLTYTDVLQDVFGKRNRSFFHRHDILKLCGLT
jgi:hypothetical protein